MKDYLKSNIPRAKALRKNMTPWERKLWYDFLRNYPIRFQRQKAIGKYIADFYCAKARLIIELDGGGHYAAEQARRDALRTQELEAMNLLVVRINNSDIDRNFKGVCEYIDRVVSHSLPPSFASQNPPPSSEGGSVCRETQFAGHAATGFLVVIEVKMRSSKGKREFFHFHFANFLRFMAANLSFTQFVT